MPGLLRSALFFCIVVVAVRAAEMCQAPGGAGSDGGLLRIAVSTRPLSESFSLRLLDEFTRQWQVAYPGLPVVDRDPNPIPHLDYLALTAGRTPLEKHTDELRAAFALASTLTDELLACRHLVIATPMYNWGPPSALKAWIDRIINVRTFYGTPVLGGLPITVIIASGGPYSIDAGIPERAKHDHLRPQILEWFTQLGSAHVDIKFVNCDPAGAIERGMVALHDPQSGFTRALAQIPAAASRIKECTSLSNPSS
jgi:FMN-dependent NADH-azoreductase